MLVASRIPSAMHRLIRHGLMFANLFEVSSPALIERYNRALEHLIGKRTGLDQFHIDLSRASPPRWATSWATWTT